MRSWCTLLCFAIFERTDMEINILIMFPIIIVSCQLTHFHMREWNSQTLMVMALIVLLDVIPTVTHTPLTYKLCQITQ
jgi:hypothetical protein